ncbi:hypothetical protein OH491_24165 [Termitidicoccus mucosus]|uniref:Uncharacterized protein n=1 Tax=Termitidicoccus mucosus TaxID=1184151 RepID=A0A178IP29_9BACT|nr:hypothetical protein AW736_02290 [Opitutaceae bacterium TSB47]
MNKFKRLATRLAGLPEIPESQIFPRWCLAILGCLLTPHLFAAGLDGFDYSTAMSQAESMQWLQNAIKIANIVLIICMLGGIAGLIATLVYFLVQEKQLKDIKISLFVFGALLILPLFVRGLLTLIS